MHMTGLILAKLGAPSVFEQGFKGNHHKGRRDITSEQQTSPRAENNKEIQEQSNASPTKARSPMGAGGFLNPLVEAIFKLFLH